MVYNEFWFELMNYPNQKSNNEVLINSLRRRVVARDYFKYKLPIMLNGCFYRFNQTDFAGDAFPCYIKSGTMINRCAQEW